MPVREIVVALLSASALSIAVTTVVAIAIRYFQFKGYVGGRFMREYFPKSATLEILWMLIALAAVGMGFSLRILGVRSIELLWMSGAIAVVIAFAMICRVVAIAVKGIMPQAQNFGIMYHRTDTGSFAFSQDEATDTTSLSRYSRDGDSG